LQAENDRGPPNTEKAKKRGCRAVLFALVLVLLGSCLLSIVAHRVVAQLDTQGGVAAEICIGEIDYQLDLYPFVRQGVWVSSPFLPYYSGHSMSSVTTHKLVCGAIPWLPRRPYFAMLVVHPSGVHFTQTW
jgi:hypothetical protein